MPPDELIASPANPRVKGLVRLRDRRERDRTGTFAVEGYRELRRALGADVVIREVYYCPELYLGGRESSLVDAAREAGSRCFRVGETAFRKVSYRDRPEGVLAVAAQFPTHLGRLVLGEEALVLVVEGIEKPGNLGTMLRSAAAAGCQAVIVCDPTTDPFNPNVVRASLGTLFVVPVGIASSVDAFAWLRAAGLRTVAATPEAQDTLWQADLSGALAVVVGSEQYGLSSFWRDGADATVRIPMPGPVDSLNAATAAALMLFEAVRRRAG